MSADESHQGGCLFNGALTVVTLLFLALNLVSWWGAHSFAMENAFGWPLRYGIGKTIIFPSDLVEIDWVAFAFDFGLHAAVLGVAIVLRKGRFGIRTMFALTGVAVLLCSLYRLAQSDPLRAPQGWSRATEDQPIAH